jgi:hypothetical protein
MGIGLQPPRRSSDIGAIGDVQFRQTSALPSWK